MRLTKTEKTRAVNAIKNAAVAMATMWDVLRDIELARKVEFDGTVAMVDTLAAACELPPSPDDLDDGDVLDSLMQCQRKAS